jgi:hypothetical protein
VTEKQAQMIITMQAVIESLNNDIISLQEEVDGIDGFQLELQSKVVCMYIPYSNYMHVHTYLRIYICT